MSRPILLLAFLCFSFLIGAGLLIRAPGLSDSDVRKLLLPPPGCAAPCWLGIRVGVTPVHSAVETLQANSRISAITVTSVGQYDMEIIEALVSFRQVPLRVVLEAYLGIIERISLRDPALQLSDLLLSLGPPTQLILTHASTQRIVAYIGFYPDYRLYVQVDLPLCNAHEAHFWKKRQNVVVEILSSTEPVEPTNASSTLLPNGEGWRQEIHNLRRGICASNVG